MEMTMGNYYELPHHLGNYNAGRWTRPIVAMGLATLIGSALVWPQMGSAVMGMSLSSLSPSSGVAAMKVTTPNYMSSTLSMSSAAVVPDINGEALIGDTAAGRHPSQIPTAPSKGFAFPLVLGMTAMMGLAAMMGMSVSALLWPRRTRVPSIAMFATQSRQEAYGTESPLTAIELVQRVYKEDLQEDLTLQSNIDEIMAISNSLIRAKYRTLTMLQQCKRSREDWKVFAVREGYPDAFIEKAAVRYFPADDGHTASNGIAAVLAAKEEALEQAKIALAGKDAAIALLQDAYHQAKEELQKRGTPNSKKAAPPKQKANQPPKPAPVAPAPVMDGKAWAVTASVLTAGLFTWRRSLSPNEAFLELKGSLLRAEKSDRLSPLAEDWWSQLPQAPLPRLVAAKLQNLLDELPHTQTIVVPRTLDSELVCYGDPVLAAATALAVLFLQKERALEVDVMYASADFTGVAKLSGGVITPILKP